MNSFIFSLNEWMERFIDYTLAWRENKKIENGLSFYGMNGFGLNIFTIFTKKSLIDEN